MKKKLISVTLVLTTIFLTTACKNSTSKNNNEQVETIVKEEKVNSDKKDTIKTVETIFSSQDIRPGNLALTKDGRLFISMNPLVSPETKVFELNKQGENIAYPNHDYATGDNSIIKAIIGIRADNKGNLWLLDMGAKQFVVWNTQDEKLVKTIKIPENVIKPASFLQDFIIDEKHNRVIIADMTQGDLKSTPEPAFIVINTKTGGAKRMAQSHPSIMPDMEGGFALNPIAIDPEFNWVYYGALHGKKVYRVPTNSFDSDENLLKTIEEYAPKSFCDGIAVDQNQNVYVTNVEDQTIGVTNKKDGFRTIATLPEGQSWPDGLYIVNNELYGTVDQLNRTAALNNGKEESTGPYLVFKTKLIE